MRNIFLSIIILGLMASCNSKPEGYSINGTLTGDVADGTAVYLKKSGENNRLVEVDTAEVKGGTFVFEGQQNQPEMHYIFIDQLGGYAATVLENGDIEFTAHKDSLGLAKSTGTPQNEFLYDFQKNSREVSQQAMNIQKDLKAASNSRDTVLINSLKEELNDLRGEYEEFELGYIKDNPNALISALLIDRAINTRTSTTEELQTLFNGLSAEIKETEAAKKVKKTLDELKKREENSKNTSVGAVAPDFSAPSPSGKLLALNDVKGKATLIDFWAAWCRPCRAENPNVVKVYDKYKEKGLSIIGVSLDKTAEAWKKAIEDDGLEWHHVSNIAYFDDAIAKLYNVDAIPATFLLDENGVIVAKNLRGPALEARISEMLN
ncbi:redoxin domain-containing protein [Maribacter sp. TH_r10]|uniref:redoxin domain-containing protein n=1 Tax=Maribacter sp. TH_r10 TaxID=3082086 RepID=UPI0029555EFD|nr:redoxin domain-containing protein [Maribacter sp. TH_r10]MDV7138708.1 redoxin domain-containing protein [Maribacter sp. TH_r10]